MRIRAVILPATWLFGLLTYQAQQVDWPWTLGGKLAAVREARTLGDRAAYANRLKELEELSPGLKALELLRQSDIQVDRSLDRAMLLATALRDPQSVDDARYFRLDLMLKGGPRQKNAALNELKTLALKGHSRAGRLLADIEETAGPDAAVQYNVVSSFTSSWTAKQTVQRLKANVDLAISPYQVRDIERVMLRLLERESSNLETRSMVELADILILRGSSDTNRSRALDLYRKAMSLGSESARVRLGLALRDLPPPYRDTRKALRLLGTAVAQGSYGAAYELAETYRNGRSVARDMRAAMRYYQVAVRGGSTGAMYRIGDMYMRGEGHPQDQERAVYWFRRAMEAGSNSGARALGVAYLEGKGVEQDITLGLTYIRQAAQRGDAASMAELAEMYQLGRHLERDFNKAGQWALAAVAAGDNRPPSLIMAAARLAQTGESANLKRASDMLRLAMKGGSPVARRQLATLLLSTGGERNEKEALSILREGASKGDAQALAALGSIYASGNGVPIDPDRSFLYYSVAAQRGSGEGLRGLAIAHAVGFGVPRSMFKAVAYFEKAAALGDRAAFRALASCWLEACLGERNIAKAVQLYATAADLGDSEANYQLATLFLDGAIPGGQSAALEQLRAAARQDHVAATKLLDKMGFGPPIPTSLPPEVERLSDLES